jgi:transmembrane sensor
MEKKLKDIQQDDLDLFLPTAEEEAEIRSAIARKKSLVPDIDIEWQKLKLQNERPKNYHSNTRWLLVAAVACLTIMFVIHISSSKSNNYQEVITKKEASNDITLTSDGGKEQTLKSTTTYFTSKSLSNITTKDNTMIVMKTPRGKDCNITLSDGTRIWLNTESSLQFPRRFTGSHREVYLTGEAYFEVAKDQHHPFVVTTEYYSATVLGTVFDARAYTKKDAKLVLVEGRVRVQGANSSTYGIVTPGQCAVFKENGRININAIDTYPVIQQKDGYFYFDKTSLLQIMIELGRWYNKTVVFENTDAMKLQLHFVAERKESLKEILKSLNEMDSVNIQLNQDDITVK